MPEKQIAHQTTAMETQQTTVCFQNSEIPLQNCVEKSNSATNVGVTAKRKRNNTSTAAVGSNFDVNKNRKVKRMRCIVDDLPVEMLDAILRNVASSDLINCRRVNRQWNEISSQILRQRADIQITFSFSCGQLMRIIQNYSRDSLLGSFLTNNQTSMSLSHLIGCLERSKHFPISSFRFKDLGTDENERDAFERFLSIWGQNIYEFGVKIDNGANNAEMLRTILLEKTPNVKKLGIEFSLDWIFGENKSPVHLFAGSNKFELPNLNVLRVHGAFEKFSGILEDILEAAPNLKLFEKCSLDNGRMLECITANELTILQSLNKLHCLENVTLMFKEDVITCLQKSPQILDLQLKCIELPPDWLDQSDHQLSSLATEFINKIFDSSRKSLQILRIPPLGWLSGLVLPKFENLQKLTMIHDEEQTDEDEVYCMFPPQFDMADSFPNLRQLTANFSGEDEYFSTYEPVNVLPKVEFLRIVFDDRYDEKLMQMTPNVKTLLVENSCELSPNLNFHEIAKYLPKLENLGWEISGKSQRHLQSSCDVDALITGFSKTFCKVKAAEFRNEGYLSKQQVTSYERYRRYTSLVDLKELRRFDMNFNLDYDSYKKCDCEEYDCECNADDDGESCDNAGFDRHSDLYQSSLTKVSQFLAFDLMPNLETNIEFTYTG